MHPILFKIGNFTFYTHGFLAVIGIIAGAILLYFLAKKQKLETTYLFDNVVWVVFFGIIGARLTYFLLYQNQFSSFREILYLWDGGMVSYGGFFFGAITFWLFLKYQKQPILEWFDIMSQSFAVGLIFGRLGNIFAGEYAGVPSSLFASFEGRVPVTLLEALALLVISVVLFLLKKYYHQLKVGMIFFSFIGLYGLGRFVIDYWRDEKDLLLMISLGQCFSLIVGMVGLLGLIKLSLSSKKVPYGRV